jgi:hypothetical protein
MEILNIQPDTTERMASKSQSNEWILDNGASNHMTWTLEIMRELHDMQTCPIGLPDGKNASATEEGVVLLDEGLKLYNVLYVPNLKCNQISLSQLMDDLDYIVHFSDKLCVMQDCTSRMLIGAGKRQDGLYYFRTIQRVQTCSVVGVNRLELWHRRQGHPSLKVTQLVLGTSKNIDHVELNEKL